MNESAMNPEISMKTIPRISAVGLFLLLMCNTASAEMYQWKDAKGKTIFSDRPPVETQKADTLGGSDSKDVAGADDPRAAIAREEAAKKKAAEKNKKLVKWRCSELEKQHATLLEQHNVAVKTDAKKADAIKIDIENHKTTMEKMCD